MSVALLTVLVYIYTLSHGLYIHITRKDFSQLRHNTEHSEGTNIMHNSSELQQLFFMVSVWEGRVVLANTTTADWGVVPPERSLSLRGNRWSPQPLWKVLEEGWPWPPEYHCIHKALQGNHHSLGWENIYIVVTQETMYHRHTCIRSETLITVPNISRPSFVTVSRSALSLEIVTTPLTKMSSTARWNTLCH